MSDPGLHSHDPERCATCSGVRHHPEDPRPIYELLAELLSAVARAPRQEAP